MHGIVAFTSDMNELAGWLRTSFPGIYIVSIEIGNDFDDSFLWSLDKQVEHFCTRIRNDIHLQQARFHQLVTKYAYEKFIQDRISIANYWHNPTQLNKYISQCHFLPDINNERETHNKIYCTNMLKLNAFVITYLDLDEIIVPKQSG
ncbi:unnamed protein product [Rotaria sordida]|uniref:Uncharacterized protein n=2 Tax=Rotaria sordida TaxID=392033 RepID=A0A816AWL6_9BILA|nr:unnamed protein product [Rotaria sordida]